ncbi:hypothetical protein JTE90_016662 [Oedothorax gibbosus]|uniref:Ferredoxin n=1 Tax=Oedothorax gibbosus TaxID=931172 RepID=A0AAV6V3S6_9ARAC|nr:hypothetical protein JTE90_016662 [Oedothorax gibbosus]
MFLNKFPTISLRLHRRLLGGLCNIRGYCDSKENGDDEKKVETVTINFVMHNGKKYQVPGIVGIDLRQAVVKADMMEKLDDFGFCGGNRWCTYCHCFFEPEVYKTLPEMCDVEKYYAEFLLNYKAGASRLGCQVDVTKEMDGITLFIPKRFPDQDD